MNKWEYKVYSIKISGLFDRNMSSEDINNQFKVFGEEGWEFVESQRIDTNAYTDYLLFIFKRKKV